MKNLIYLFSLLSIISLSSCSSDDDGSSGGGTISFDGKEISIQNALIEDYGADGDHYNYDFTLTGTDGNTPYIVYFELFSPLSAGTGFETGTFNYVQGSIGTDIYYFSVAELIIGQQENLATAGQVVVSGEGDNYTVTANLTFADDRTLTLTYSGAFRVEQGL